MLTLLTLLCTVCCVVVFPLVPPVVPPFCLLATACSMMESKLLRKSREINTKVSTSAHKRRRKCPEDIDDPGHKKGKERERDRRHSTRSAKKKIYNGFARCARSSPGIHVRPHVLLVLVLVATEPKLGARHFSAEEGKKEGVVTVTQR